MTYDVKYPKMNKVDLGRPAMRDFQGSELPYSGMMACGFAIMLMFLLCTLCMIIASCEGRQLSKYSHL